MGKKFYGKMPRGIEVRFLFGSRVYSGTILNLSKSHILIYARLHSTADFRGNVNLLIIHDGRRLAIPVRIRRMAVKYGYYNLINVEVLDSTPDYLEFFEHTMPAYKQYSIHTLRLLKKENPDTFN